MRLPFRAFGYDPTRRVTTLDWFTGLPSSQLMLATAWASTQWTDYLEQVLGGLCRPGPYGLGAHQDRRRLLLQTRETFEAVKPYPYPGREGRPEGYGPAVMWNVLLCGVLAPTMPQGALRDQVAAPLASVRELVDQAPLWDEVQHRVALQAIANGARDLGALRVAVEMATT